MNEKVAPYKDRVAGREELVLRTYEYRFPFNYLNINVHRPNLLAKYKGAETPGLEMETGDYIEIEEEPVVAVTVVGSACTTPGSVMIEAEPARPFPNERKGYEVSRAVSVRQRIDNLCGTHIRGDAFGTGKIDYTNDPLTRMSTAHFKIPKSKKVKISSGSQIP